MTNERLCGFAVVGISGAASAPPDVGRPGSEIRVVGLARMLGANRAFTRVELAVRVDLTNRTNLHPNYPALTRPGNELMAMPVVTYGESATAEYIGW